MTPEEVETRVIVPLEYELLGIPRQTRCCVRRQARLRT